MSGPNVLTPGLQNPVLDAQSIFHSVLNALAQPGTVHPCIGIASTPLPPVMAAFALTFLDHETPYALAGFPATLAVSDYLGFHTGARLAATLKAAAFVFAADAATLPALSGLSTGTPAYPDRSATVILGAGDFGSGVAVELSGPGIADVQRFSASGLDAGFWRMAVENAALFPQGVDFILAGTDALAALPRSTAIALLS